MKKLLIMACALTILTGSAMAADTAKNDIKDFAKPGVVHRVPPTKAQIEQHKKVHEEAFEQKLGLTEVQKLKARELRKDGFTKIKPVMDDLNAKKKEAAAIQKSDLSVEAKEEKLTVLDKEIQELRKKASTIRKQNMKDFENILTRDQKKTLKEMKKEGRDKFHKEHKPGAFPPPPCPNINK